jgi:hypothetical protein
MELETMFGMHCIVQKSDLHKLTYLRAMIEEIFCLHPPALLLVPHSSTKKVCGIAKGYDIPPHTRGFMNVWAMGQDPSIRKNLLSLILNISYNNIIIIL